MHEAMHEAHFSPQWRVDFFSAMPVPPMGPHRGGGGVGAGLGKDKTNTITIIDGGGWHVGIEARTDTMQLWVGGAGMLVSRLEPIP